MEIYWQQPAWALISLAMYRRCVVIIWMEFSGVLAAPINLQCQNICLRLPGLKRMLKLIFVTAAAHRGRQTTSQTLSMHFLKDPHYKAEFKFLRMTETTVTQVGTTVACVCFSWGSVGVSVWEMGRDTSEREISRYVIWHNVSPARTPSCLPTCHRSCTTSKQMLYQ